MPSSQSGHSAAPGSPSPRRRSLADELRSWTPARLAALLTARPDLAVPPPASVAALAERASQKASVALAMDRLDAFTLQVLQALAVQPAAGPVTAASTAELLGLPESDPRVGEAIEALRGSALLWGPDEALRPLVNTREALGENPVGLGPPLASALSASSPAWLQDVLVRLGLPATPDPVTAVAAIGDLAGDAVRMGEVLRGGPQGVEAVLEKLVWGPPFGRVTPPAAGRAVAGDADGDAGSGADAADSAALADAREAAVFDGDPVLERAHGVAVAALGHQEPDEPAPLRWLLDRGLLGRWSQDTVVLPREIAFYLRRHVFGTGLHRDLAAEPPTVVVRHEDVRATDQAAAAAAVTVVRRVEEALDSWAAAPPGVLRSGGVSVRDLRRTAAVLDVPEDEAAFLVELAYAAGLVAADLGSGFWLPTPAYDRWLDLSTERRWADLALSWLTSDRAPGRVGTPDDRNRAIAALSAEVAAWPITELRRDVLQTLAGFGPGGTVAADALADRLFWERPRRSGPTAVRMIAWTLREAVWLGVVAPVRGIAGVLTTAGRALAAGTDLPDTAVAALSSAMPDPVHQVFIQGDLTAIAPGPLVDQAAKGLAQMADVESAGAATVYRFTNASMRRAFDAGLSAEEIHAFLAERSAYEVPQALTYLVDDVARRHGRIRVGAVSSYIRADNDAALAELMADRRTAHWGLRRISAGVAVSDLPADELLAGLREAGYAPVGEAEESGGSGGAPSPGAAVASVRVRRASAFHPYAPQRVVGVGSGAVLGLAEELLAGG